MRRPIALYARVSSDKQAQDGTIESQLSSIREYATANGYSIEEDLIFADNGISGTTLVRPALDRLRDKAAAGEIQQILVLCPDRLARKYTHQLILVEEFRKLGVEIQFANRAITQTPEDQLLFQIQGVISEYEREKIVERHRRGKLHKAKAGKVCVLSGAPYGYVYIRAGDREDARYEIHPDEAEVVRQVFRWFTYEKLSIGEIARRLTQRKVPTRRNFGHWERSVIWLMLKNPAYAGKAAYRKTMLVPRMKPTKLARDNAFYPKRPNSSTRDREKSEWITIPVPAIVAEEVFEKAQIQLQENKKLSPRNNKKYEYLLGGLLHCKECGYSMYGKPASNSRYKRLYYRCMGQDGHRWPKGRVCGSHPIRVEALDDLVWDQTRLLLENPDVLLQEYSRRLDSKRKGKLDLEAIVSKKNGEIRQQNQEKERLLDLYQNGTLSLDEIEGRLKSIRSKIQKLEQECSFFAVEEKRKQDQLQLIEQFQDFRKRMKSNLADLNFEDRKKLVRLLVSEVVVDVNKEELVVRHTVPISKSWPLCPGSNLTTTVQYLSPLCPRLVVRKENQKKAAKTRQSGALCR